MHTQEASKALPEEVMDAPPSAIPLPDVVIEDIPPRPDAFLPLGSEGKSVEESLWDDLKDQARLTNALGREAVDADSEHLIKASQPANHNVSNPWTDRGRLVKEQSCVSAN